MLKQVQHDGKSSLRTTQNPLFRATLDINRGSLCRLIGLNQNTEKNTDFFLVKNRKT